MENTGRHSQFYEKFTTRHHIAVILRELWSVPDHRQRMLEQSKYGQNLLCVNVFVGTLLEQSKCAPVLPRPEHSLLCVNVFVGAFFSD
jgi:hypothetical protein